MNTDNCANCGKSTDGVNVYTVLNEKREPLRCCDEKCANQHKRKKALKRATFWAAIS